MRRALGACIALSIAIVIVLGLVTPSAIVVTELKWLLPWGSSAIVMVFDPSVANVTKGFSGLGVAYLSFGTVVIGKAFVFDPSTPVILYVSPEDLHRMEAFAALQSALPTSCIGAVEYPTVSVTLFLYNSSGSELICHAWLGGYEWSRFGSVEGALSYVKRGLVLVVTSRNLVCGAVNGSRVSEALVELAKSAGLRAGFDDFGLPFFGWEKPRVVKVEGSGSCPAFREEVFNWYLYDERFSAPPGWLRGLKGVPIDVVERLWRLFAVSYSVRYEYNADVYTMRQALALTARRIGIGLMPMQWLAEVLARQCSCPTPTWVPTPVSAPIKTVEVPWLGVSLRVRAPNASVLIGAALGTAPRLYDYSGLALFGIPIWGIEYVNLQPALVAMAMVADGYGYVKAPTTLVYIGDAIVVNLRYAYVVDHRGCRWHVVWPEIAFVPMYAIASVQWLRSGSAYLSPNETLAILRDVAWSAREELVYSAVTGTNATTVFQESSDEVANRSGGLITQSLSVYKPWLEAVVANALGKLSNPVARESIAFTATAISFEQYTASTHGIAFHLIIHIDKPSKHPYALFIYRLTCPLILVNAYRKRIQFHSRLDTKL